MKSLKINYTTENIHKISVFLGYPSPQDLFFNIAKGTVETKDLKNFLSADKKNPEQKTPRAIDVHQVKDYIKNISSDEKDCLLLGDDLLKMDYKLSPCCNPIPGDDVFGFITISEGIKIHRTTCPNAERLVSNFGYRIIKAKWSQQQKLSFLAGLKIVGLDDMGLLNSITKVISNDFKINIRSIVIDTNDGVFEGSIIIFVNDTNHLNELIKRLTLIKGITSVSRFEAIDDKK